MLLALLLSVIVGVFIIIGAYYWIPLIIVLSVFEGILVIMLYVGLIGFTANAVQFGMDQLHDFPGEDSTLFIHWYVWTHYASFLTVQLALNLTMTFPAYYNIIGLYLMALIPVIVVMVLVITLCLVRRRRRWLLIEPGGLNPYKLVYRVTKFAHQHN